MTKDDFSSAHRLRSGRWSAPNQIYMITTVTKDRRQIFEDLFKARMLINIMREDARRGSHQTLAYVLMPDHLHWLLQLQEGSLSGLVGRVKSLAAKRLGRPIWQDGFHDHALRREEDLRDVARYIVANPLRAGLVQRLGDYRTGMLPGYNCFIFPSATSSPAACIRRGARLLQERSSSGFFVGGPTSGRSSWL